MSGYERRQPVILFLRSTATMRVSVDLLPADLTRVIIHERIFGLNVSILSLASTIVNTEGRVMRFLLL